MRASLSISLPPPPSCSFSFSRRMALWVCLSTGHLCSHLPPPATCVPSPGLSRGAFISSSVYGDGYRPRAKRHRRRGRQEPDLGRLPRLPAREIQVRRDEQATAQPYLPCRFVSRNIIEFRLDQEAMYLVEGCGSLHLAVRTPGPLSIPRGAREHRPLLIACLVSGVSMELFPGLPPALLMLLLIMILIMLLLLLLLLLIMIMIMMMLMRLMSLTGQTPHTPTPSSGRETGGPCSTGRPPRGRAPGRPCCASLTRELAR